MERARIVSGNLRRWAAFALLAAAIGEARAAPATLLNNVTIVDTRSGALHANREILIRDGRIVRIAAAGSIKAGAADQVIDGTGKFVVPGYLDMHAHPLNAGDPETSLPLMLANGITGFRQMAGAPPLLAARKAGKLPTDTLPVTPKLLSMPGAVLAGPLGATPEAAVAQVEAQKAQGADFIKVVDMGEPAFLALLDRAKALGMPVAGHLPNSVDVRDAARRGMRSIEHLGPTGSVLEACSTDEKAVRRQISEQPTGASHIAFDLPAAQLQRMTANPMTLVSEAEYRALQHVLDTYSEPKCRALARMLARSGVWQVPTMIRLKAMQFGDDPGFRNDPNLRFIPAADRQLWQEVGDEFAVKLSPESRATLKQLFAAQLRLIRLFDAEKVPMLAGTDFGGQWIVPGFSLHQEFDLLAEAGIPPLHILQMATLNGARFLGREKNMGTVEAGKDADLVLLSANPLADTRNLHRIDAVLRGGVYYPRAELDAIERRAVQP